MTRYNISVGPFTMLVSLCGEYWVAPGGVHIKRMDRAEQVASMYAGVMTNA